MHIPLLLAPSDFQTFLRACKRMNRIRGKGGKVHPQILADQLTLFQQGWQIMPTTSLLALPSDFQAFPRLWSQKREGERVENCPLIFNELHTPTLLKHPLIHGTVLFSKLMRYELLPLCQFWHFWLVSLLFFLDRGDSRAHFWHFDSIIHRLKVKTAEWFHLVAPLS